MVGYGYDEIGNRTQATEGVLYGSTDQTTTYAANALNQYSAITNPDPGKRAPSQGQGSIVDRRAMNGSLADNRLRYVTDP